MGLINLGDKLHVAERRYFESDLRRHFVGTVVASEENIVRIKGYVWVFNTSINEFQKRPELRERILVLGERHTVNVLPENINIEDLVYQSMKGVGLVLADNKGYILQINEFTGTI